MIVFCILSFFSVVYSLILSVGSPILKPISNIGFPYKYHYQFWVSGADAPNCGWKMDYFIYDILLTWIVVSIAYFIIKRKTP